MLVEKYIVIGIKHPKDVIIDLTRKNIYDGMNIIDPISVVREQRNDIFVDLFGETFMTKAEAFQRLDEIRWNVKDVMYWSILPIVVDVSIKEARYLKLLKIKKKIK